MDYGRKTRTGNSHLADATSARKHHITGTSDDGVVKSIPGRLLRVVLNTNGATLTLRDGASEVIGIIASDAPEQTFYYGIYCDTDIRVEAGGNVDATIVFS